MNLLGRGLALVCMALVLGGCKKEDPNPELLDPIYKDLDARANAAQKVYDDEIKRQAGELAQKLERSEPNSIERKNAERDLNKSKEIALQQQQWAHFYRIRTQRRLVVDRIAYKEALAKGSQWPDPREYSDYLANMRLRDAPRNWGARVPKLQDRLTKREPASKEKGQKPEE